MTLSISTLSTMSLIITTLSKIVLSITMNNMQHSAYHHLAKTTFSNTRLSFILSVTNKPSMLNIVILNVIMLNVVAPTDSPVTPRI